MAVYPNYVMTGKPNPIANQQLLTNEISVKPIGSNVSSGSAAGNTWCCKIAAPGDFDAVKLVIFHHDASATTIYQAVVAATETALQTTDVNRWRPVVGGVEYSALNASEAHGWKTVTWAGVSTKTSAAGSATLAAINAADWIPIRSVPRSDGALYPLLQLRISVTAGATSFGGFTSGMFTATAENGGFIIQSGWGADATGLYVTAPATNNPTGEQSTHLMSFGLVFRTRKRGISLMTIGDSLTQNNTVVPSLYSSLGLRAAAAISATGIPCGHINGGMSSQTMTTFEAQGNATIAAMLPNVVLIQGLSPNGPTGFNTDPFMRDSIRRQSALVGSMVSAARSIRAVPIISTGIPMRAALIPADAQDSLRRSYNDSIRMSAQHFVDFDRVVTDNAAPARIQAALQYDVDHPNETGVQLEANALVSVIRSIFS